jgi:hypothetical protein
MIAALDSAGRKRVVEALTAERGPGPIPSGSQPE